MALKQYVCNRWKSLQIGRHIKFQDGTFETEDPKLQHQIESSDEWPIHIHYKDTVEEMERIGRKRLEAKNAELARVRQAMMDEEAAKDKDQAKADSKAAKARAKAAKDERTRRRIADASQKIETEGLAADEKAANDYGVKQTSAKGK